GSTIVASVIIATNTLGMGVYVRNTGGSIWLTTDTITGGTQGAGINIGQNAGISRPAGPIVITSVTVTGGQYGVYITTMSGCTRGTCGPTQLSISSLTFSSGLTAGATAIEFAGGQFVLPIFYAQFSDPNIGTNVDAVALSTASNISMMSHYGTKTGA